MKRTLETARLILRRWGKRDLAPFAAINADPVAMEFFPSLETRAQSDARVAQIERNFDRDGFGLWAVELRAAEAGAAGNFIGFIGAQRPSFDAHFTPCIEIGWRLTPTAWGHGYATEGAIATIEDVFAREPRCDEIVAMTAVANRRSRSVMERLGMKRDEADDFDHPRIAPGHSLRRHVLFRLQRAAWSARMPT